MRFDWASKGPAAELDFCRGGIAPSVGGVRVDKMPSSRLVELIMRHPLVPLETEASYGVPRFVLAT